MMRQYELVERVRDSEAVNVLEKARVLDLIVSGGRCCGVRASVAGRPASVSPAVYRLIRQDIGYDGVLITDCLTMEALKGTWPERVRAALDAGCDIALHSQGDLAASEAAAKAAGPLSDESLARINRAQARLGNKRVDVLALHAEVERIFTEHGLA